MIQFDEYVAKGGKIQDQPEFEDLEPLVVDLVDAMIKERIPFWRVQPIEDYPMDLSKVLIHQIDYISEHGGADAFRGLSDLNFTGATTSGFSYKVDASKTKSFHDVPISSIASTELDYQLRISGLSGAAIW